MKKMKKNQVLLLPKFYRSSVKTINSVFTSPVLFFLLLVFAAFSTSFAQTISYSDPNNWMCHPVLKSTDAARQQDLSVTEAKLGVFINTSLSAPDQLTKAECTKNNYFSQYISISAIYNTYTS